MKYVVGIDFGTLSARAAVVSTETGAIISQSICEYKHGVITENLPENYALEDPTDVLEALEKSVSVAVKTSKINPEQIVGIGLDATSYSMVCCDEYGNPMSMKSEFCDEPMALIRLWKHHAAHPQAERMAKLHEETGLIPQIEYYGGKISPEFAFPKILETYEKAPDLFNATHRFCDLGEWIVWRLTGKPVYSLFANSFKSLYTDRYGSPSRETLNLLAPGFGDKVIPKFYGPFAEEDKACGYLTEEYASKFCLKPGIPVAPPLLDGAAPGLTVNVSDPNSIVITLGTSICLSFISEICECMPGLNAVAKDIYIPGYFAYDYGQPCVGDMLDWFIKSFAKGRNKSEAHKELTEKCSKGKPYLNSLSLMDWFNGNRSILHNERLKGCIIGLTMDTEPEDIYCAMIQGICCGTAKIIEHIKEYGIHKETIVLCGGIADKNSFYVQQFSNILGKPVKLIKDVSMTLLGSAIKGAVASGMTFKDAVSAISPKEYIEILPDMEYRKEYEAIYARWSYYHDLLSANWR